MTDQSQRTLGGGMCQVMGSDFLMPSPKRPLLEMMDEMSTGVKRTVMPARALPKYVANQTLESKPNKSLLYVDAMRCH